MLVETGSCLEILSSLALLSIVLEIIEALNVVLGLELRPGKSNLTRNSYMCSHLALFLKTRGEGVVSVFSVTYSPWWLSKHSCFSAQ